MVDDWNDFLWILVDSTFSPSIIKIRSFGVVFFDQTDQTLNETDHSLPLLPFAGHVTEGLQPHRAPSAIGTTPGQPVWASSLRLLVD